MSDIPNCEEYLNKNSEEDKNIIENLHKGLGTNVRKAYYDYYNKEPYYIEEHEIPIKFRVNLNEEFKHYPHYVEDTGNTVSSFKVERDEDQFNIFIEPRNYQYILDFPTETSSTILEYTDLNFPNLKEIIMCKEPPSKIEMKKPIEEKIFKTISEYSSKIKQLKSYDKKIELLIEFNKFLKDNEDIVRRKFSGKLKGILKSL